MISQSFSHCRSSLHPISGEESDSVRKFIKNGNVKQQLWSIFSHGDVKKLAYCCPFHSHVDWIYCGKSTPTSRNQIRKGRKYHYQIEAKCSWVDFFSHFLDEFHMTNPPVSRQIGTQIFKSELQTWTSLSLAISPPLRSYDAIKRPPDPPKEDCHFTIFSLAFFSVGV